MKTEGAENASERSSYEEKHFIAKRVKLKTKKKKREFLAHFHSSKVDEKRPKCPRIFNDGFFIRDHNYNCSTLQVLFSIIQ